jgi:uncharacterized DUF497 family protein
MVVSPMREFKWNPEKNEQLMRERGLSFELVVEAAASGRIKDDVPHPNQMRGHQRVLVVYLNGRHIAVPYVRDGDVKFLKTMYYSRALDARYGGCHGQTHH